MLTISKHFAALLSGSLAAGIMVLLAGCTDSGNNQQSEPANKTANGESSMTAAPSVSQAPFGTLPDGQEVTLFTVTNSNGVEAKIMTYGGVVTSLKVPDSKGNLENVVFGFDSLEPYIENNVPYFGALIGRFGNRIDKGQFTIDGETYQLSVNDGPNHLHGGAKGFDKRVWKGESFSNESGAGVKLNLLSEDGDMGYPGNLQVTAIYTLTNSNELQLEFKATTDKATPVNLTHHSYFNLAGDGTILDHRMMIDAKSFTPVNETLIPTGEIRSVEGTPFDFREPTTIGERINADNQQLKFGQGYDHNWVLDKSEPGAYELAARVVEPDSGRVLEVYTVEPAIQFYSGNFLDGSLKGQGRSYDFRSAFCLEPQHYPDSPNHPEFPNTILRPGEEYSTRMSYAFSTVDSAK